MGSVGRNWALGLRLDPGRLVGKGMQSFCRSETTQSGLALACAQVEEIEPELLVV